jgi:hypothetical protein
MRPWDVFIAQILQFQDMLADYYPTDDGGGSEHTAKQQMRAALEDIQELLRKGKTKRPLERIESMLSQPRGVVRAARLPRLTELGIDELPPAGFLPIQPGAGPVDRQLTEIFPEHIDLRFCSCRPDYVAHAIEEAQHLDRIPLDQGPAQVDMLVPDGQLDAAGQLTTKHAWVAFHRRRDRDCGDLVDVYLYELDGLEFRTAISNLAQWAPPGTPTDKTTASYPVGSWALPDVQSSVREWTRNRGQAAVLGLARSEERLPLAGVRAALLVTTFEQQRPTPAIHTVVRPDLPRDTIYIVIGPASRRP